jgi:hypothetical protein
MIDDPEEKSALLTFKTLFSAILWIFKNSKYVLKKRKDVKTKRILSTKELKKLKLIT